MKAFTAASHFCTLSFINCWVNCVIYFVSCVFGYRSMCSIYMVSEPWWTRHLSSLDLRLDHFLWAKLILPVLHQKRRIYHLISQVRKLLIKLAWSTMLGVKEIPKVQTVDLTLYVWLCDRLSTLLTTFATSSPFFSLHSLQASLSSHCIHYNNSSLLTTFKMAHPVELLTPFNYQ